MNEISVIIPTYNRLKTLIQVLPTYEEQDFVKEIIVIDDCSSDGTRDFLVKASKKNKKIRPVFNDVNLGQPASQNKAIKLCNGGYIFIGEGDVSLPTGFLKKLLLHLKKNKCDIISGRRIWLRFGETMESGLKRANEITGKIFDDSILTTNCELKISKDVEVPLVDASMLISKRVFREIKYDEHYRKNAWRQETDFQLTAITNCFKTYYCPHVHSFHLYKENDKGGNHSHNFFRYEIDIQKNNFYMARKHWKLLTEKYKLNPLFFIRFFMYRLNKVIDVLVGNIKKFV